MAISDRQAIAKTISSYIYSQPRPSLTTAHTCGKYISSKSSKISGALSKEAGREMHTYIESSRCCIWNSRGTQVGYEVGDSNTSHTHPLAEGFQLQCVMKQMRTVCL